MYKNQNAIKKLYLKFKKFAEKYLQILYEISPDIWTHCIYFWTDWLDCSVESFWLGSFRLGSIRLDL